MNNYDDIAQEYEAYGKDAITDIEIGYKNALRLAGSLEGKKVLDYGCGVGKFSRILKDHGADVVGIDIAEKELAIARRKHADILFYSVEEARGLFKEEFDLVTLNFVITAIPSREGIRQVFNDARTFLKKRGTLVMMNSNYEKSGGCEFLTFKIGEVRKEIGAPLTVFLGGAYDFPITDFYYSADFYIKELTDAGFAIEETSEPLADTDDRPWKDEKTSPPFILIKAAAV